MRKLRWWIAIAGSVVLLGGPAAPVRGEPAPDGAARVVIETSVGDLRIELDAKNAPLTTQNFLRYVQAGFYDGTIFHRVIDNFMVQGGGYTRDMKQKTPLFPSIGLESRNGLKNARGAVAMARGRAPDSATCQFFVNLVDNPFLDYNPTTNPAGYAVFGRVVDGWPTLDRMRQAKVTESPADVQADGTRAVSLPVTPIVIRTIRVESGTPDEHGR